MTQDPARVFQDRQNAAYLLLRHLRKVGEPVLSWAEVSQCVEDFLDTEDGAALPEADARVLRRIQEVILDGSVAWLAIRHRVAEWVHLQVLTEEVEVRAVEVDDYLRAKERLALHGRAPGDGDVEAPWVPELDLRPFERRLPRLERSSSIGRGVEFLNRHLSGRLFADEGGLDRILEFLRLHEVQGRPLLLNGGIESVGALKEALRQGLELLHGKEPEAEAWCSELRKLGFEQGWGGTAARAAGTMELLSQVLEAPAAGPLAEFLERVPMIFSIAILSPHGFFAQSDVLGKPDTGGQVVYILDQVRALERAMTESIAQAGLDIEPQIVVLSRLIPEAQGSTCDQRVEEVVGTRNARILRVPFRDASGEVIPHWISRFDLWPYLERYALDAERELLADLGGRPDFIIGNYSDGNLVASLMAHRLGVTQCNIAHALEKTKYKDSDLKWAELEEEHHFSCQFTADVIAMNTADFIITSTYQEIAGTGDTVGQYESYRSFTLPGLYRVIAGIDCYDPKFNIVSPGADARVFFPFSEEERRMGELREDILGRIYGSPDRVGRGRLENRERPLLFAMSRLDRIKNMAGLLQWYAESPDLQAEANLLLAGGHLDPSDSDDRDERAQIEGMHALLDAHDLDGKVRWLPMIQDKHEVAEFYRVVADTRGAFVQPALFEAFGLTVVEAMSSGLPVFATRYGGPLEIIEDGVSGFHIDPARGEEAASRMTGFLRAVREDDDSWHRISRGSVERVRARYNWPLYASTLLKLSRIYGFWRFMSSLEREQSQRYLEMFYALMYRPRARTVAPGGAANPPGSPFPDVGRGAGKRDGNEPGPRPAPATGTSSMPGS